jgi:Cysteine-rich secretory protein family
VPQTLVHRSTVRRSLIDRHPRALAAVVVFALLAFVGNVATPVQASPENPAADEAQFVAKLNETRAKGGVAPLTVDPELRDLSRGWAQAMADAGHISHANPISEGVTADWRKLGENVGTGGNVTVVMNAFIASPGHYANIMDPEFTKVGVGVVWVGNALYTTHRFMKLAGEPAATPPPDPTPVPPEATAPPARPPEPVAPKRVATTTTAPPPTPPTTAPPPTTTTAPPPPPASPARVASVLGALIAAAH